MAICLEDLDAARDDERYMRCVALPGGEPGLGLNGQGAVRWMPDGPTDYELWVSADARLVLVRGQDAGPVSVTRAGRSLDAPSAQPVVLVDQDLVQVGGRRLLVHIHGETEQVHEPELLSGSSLARMVRAAAAALALTTAVGVGGVATGSPMLPADPSSGVEPIDVRKRPPKPVARRPRLCDIISRKTDKKGLTTLALVCTKKLTAYVGMVGEALDASTGLRLKNGQVKVEQVAGNKLTATTRLIPAQLKRAKKVRFWAR